VNGKIVEHWDSATKGAAGPVAAKSKAKVISYSRLFAFIRGHH
jgi:hypothetical protein